MRQHYNHTKDEVRRYLADALELVSELEVDDGLRGIAFANAVQFLSAKTQFWHPSDQMPIVEEARSTERMRFLTQDGNAG